jgi:DNA-binding CsgD family transcriptional regulator
VLVGRSAETAAIDRLLAAAREGRSGVLVIRGDAGIGKSSLLDHALEHADDVTVLRGVGIESESELPFAALHQILRPILDGIERLPEPQAAALRAAFALSDETVDDRFRISLGVLGLLAEAAEARPLLCVVDDAQWLDGASADALVFAARRLEAEPIALLFAAREHGTRQFAAGSLPELHLAALDAAAARTLVTAALGAGTASEVIDWLVQSANGNPLALVELPASLSAKQLSGVEPLDRALLPTTSVEEAYLERVNRLTPATRSLLVLAAAEGSGDRATVMRAAAELGLLASELTAAETEGLVRVGPERIEFRHPLVRSAVYRGAGFAERDRAHLALAWALSGEADADRRAWHRAAATVGTDDEVADELEQNAGRARLRAGYGAVSAALERAADLSSATAERGRRFALAATAANLAGRAARAIALADRAEPLVVDPILRADLANVRGSAELLVGRPAVASDILAAGAEAAGPHDSKRALDLAGAAVEAAAMGGDMPRVARACALGMAIEPDPDDPDQVVLAGLHRGGAAMFRGDAAIGAPLMASALAGAEDLSDSRHIVWCGVAARSIGDDVRARNLFARAVAEARRSGALRVLVHALAAQATQSVTERMLSDAAAQADEAVRLARDLGADNPAVHALAVLAWVDAFHGREDECRRRADEALKLAVARGLAVPAAIATWAVAELALGRGRWEDALAAFEALAEVTTTPVVMLTTPDRLEAAVRAGVPDSARAAFVAFETWTESTRARWAPPHLERCRALLAADGEQAATHFDAALRLHAEVSSASFDRARTELLYGELLRREKQRVAARRQLRSALTTFEQLGGVLWAERARGELRATGETARRRDSSTLAQLTPQELQIARLVGEGSSNKEVAAQLFLSPRTVEYHLRKVFQKLAISSRAELIRQAVREQKREEPATMALTPPQPVR